MDNKQEKADGVKSIFVAMAMLISVVVFAITGCGQGIPSAAAQVKSVADIEVVELQKLVETLKDENQRLKEQVLSLTPKPESKASKRSNLARDEWVKEMEKFVRVFTVIKAEKQLDKLKALQDKCLSIQEQLAKVNNGATVAVDELTDDEMELGKSWPMAFYRIMCEWKLYKNGE